VDQILILSPDTFFFKWWEGVVPFLNKGIFPEHPPRYTPALGKWETSGALTLEKQSIQMSNKKQNLG